MFPLWCSLGQTHLCHPISADSQLQAMSSFINFLFLPSLLTFPLLPSQVIDAGANALVAGSAVFKTKSYRDAIAGIKASKAPAMAGAR